MRLLIVEDNVELARLVANGLLAAGYEADVVGTAGEAREATRGMSYAAMILDLGLPDGDGLSLVEPAPLRSTAGDRADGAWRPAGPGRGPAQRRRRLSGEALCVLEELVARLEAVLRRPGQLLGSSLSLGNLVYDTEGRQIFIDGVPRALSARETSVLEILLRRQGRVVPKKNVEDHIFGLAGEVASNAVEVYVSRLRKQLAEYGARVVIHTIRGVGYLMAEEK